MVDRASQLKALASSLALLVDLLEKDPSCTWTRHFLRSLETARELQAKGFTQAQLNELSGSVRCVYAGMGSFNDYISPHHKVREAVARASGDVFGCAVRMMVAER
jgi:hypothetical protein